MSAPRRQAVETSLTKQVAMAYAEAVVERAMKMDLDPRTNGALGLYDKRRRPSRRRGPAAEVQRVLQLYREQYRDFNIRHVHHLAKPGARGEALL